MAEIQRGGPLYPPRWGRGWELTLSETLGGPPGLGALVTLPHPPEPQFPHPRNTCVPRGLRGLSGAGSGHGEGHLWLRSPE